MKLLFPGRRRNYGVYIRDLDAGAKRKYEAIRDFVKPGRIVDLGCGTGSILRELSFDPRLTSSRLYGVEVSRKLWELCRRRKKEGWFGRANIRFSRRNITQEGLFPDNFADTFLTSSLTHEIESYQGRITLLSFIGRIYDQIAPGGVWINYDVVGPEEKNEEVFLWLNQKDGTYQRFLRFAADFRREWGYRVKYRKEKIGEKEFVALSMPDAAEFISKKDYLDNWRNETQETFCFWSFSDWKKAVQSVGFKINPRSCAFTNPWIIKNRYEGKVELFRKKGMSLEKIPYPPTNMVLVGEKAA